MAQIEPKPGSGRARKKSTHVDMTAMVDVAFLLLTFFILTTTMIQETKALNFLAPVDDGRNPNKINCDKILTLVPGAGHKVHYFFGLPDAEVYTTNLGPDGLRTVLLGHRNRYPNPCERGQTKGCWDPIVVLKPSPDSHYRDLIDVLDELALAGLGKYSYGQLGVDDSLLLADHRLK